MKKTKAVFFHSVPESDVERVLNNVLSTINAEDVISVDVTPSVQETMLTGLLETRRFAVLICYAGGA